MKKRVQLINGKIPVVASNSNEIKKNEIDINNLSKESIRLYDTNCIDFNRINERLLISDTYSPPSVVIDIKGTFEIEIEDLIIKGLIIYHYLNRDFNNDYVRDAKFVYINNNIIQVRCNLVSLDPNNEISPYMIIKLLDSIEKDINYKTIYKDKEVCFCEFQYLLYGRGAGSHFDTLEDLLKAITEMNGTYRLF